MHGSVFFNSGLQTPSASTLPALSVASLYGKGIFTTIAIYDGQPFLWAKHWRRLGENASRLELDLTEFGEAAARSALDELIAANSAQNARARITFFDESASELWPQESERRTSLLITTADRRTRADNFSLTLSPFVANSASPLSGVKSCNYLEKILALDEAKHRGFDEAIQLNERGKIVSACMANCFWLKDEQLFTPSLKTGCLAGTTREFVLENVDCDEVEAGIEELRSADEIFLTSAGIGIIQIAEFDGRKLKRSPHPIVRVLPERA
jgi:branched-subunit amino acid aminotransferase/4-amino-4-deoxychorismate lyase